MWTAVVIRLRKENGAHPVENREKLDLAAKSHLGEKKSKINLF